MGKEGGMKKFEMFKRQDDKQVARFLFLLLCFLAEWRVSDVHAAEYKLVMSEEATVCQSLVKLANEGLLETKNLEDPARLGTPDLNFVNWEMASRAPSFQNHNGNVEGALFDINNDGQLDWVVRIQWAIGGDV